ncbi:MAG: carbon storage regulator [Spiribacter salinus]|uniref:Translational regulator CsrA n=1 Tax=Spiribacter salinus TaxID=1335746 RepID=A0A540VQN6_9GAMM|nr:MAG: carbon storage regulator [Spiribacter salinus]
MLILSRRAGETVLIGDRIRVTVTAIQGGQVRIGIDAPADVEIVRFELAIPGRHKGTSVGDEPARHDDTTSDK